MEKTIMLNYHKGLTADDMMKELVRIATTNKPEGAECWSAAIRQTSELPGNWYVDIRYTKNGVCEEIGSIWYGIQKK